MGSEGWGRGRYLSEQAQKWNCQALLKLKQYEFAVSHCEAALELLAAKIFKRDRSRGQVLGPGNLRQHWGWFVGSVGDYLGTAHNQEQSIIGVALRAVYNHYINNYIRDIQLLLSWGSFQGISKFPTPLHHLLRGPSKSDLLHRLTARLGLVFLGLTHMRG